VRSLQEPHLAGNGSGCGRAENARGPWRRRFSSHVQSLQARIAAWGYGVGSERVESRRAGRATVAESCTPNLRPARDFLSDVAILPPLTYLHTTLDDVEGRHGEVREAARKNASCHALGVVHAVVLVPHSSHGNHAFCGAQRRVGKDARRSRHRKLALRRHWRDERCRTGQGCSRVEGTEHALVCACEKTHARYTHISACRRAKRECLEAIPR
jgi:hypothetical protein